MKLTALKNFPITGIHNKAVKHMIIEMYAATASEFKKEMAAEVGDVRLLHLNLDLWVDKFSSLKYIGKNYARGRLLRLLNCTIACVT